MRTKPLSSQDGRKDNKDMLASYIGFLETLAGRIKRERMSMGTEAKIIKQGIQVIRDVVCKKQEISAYKAFLQQSVAATVAVELLTHSWVGLVRLQSSGDIETKFPRLSVKTTDGPRFKVFVLPNGMRRVVYKHTFDLLEIPDA